MSQFVFFLFKNGHKTWFDDGLNVSLDRCFLAIPQNITYGVFRTFLGWLAAAFATSEKVITVAALVISRCVTKITENPNWRRSRDAVKRQIWFSPAASRHDWIFAGGIEPGSQQFLAVLRRRGTISDISTSRLLKHREFIPQSVKNGAKWVLFTDGMICEVQWTLTEGRPSSKEPWRRDVVKC